MAAAWYSLVAAAAWLVAGALGAVTPGGHYNLTTQEEFNTEARGRQLFYLPQIAPSPQLQRLELGVDNPDAQYYQPNQQRQDVESFAASDAQKTTKNEPAPAKLETLEPDAELIPGAQQQPQGPPTQVPVAPQPNIPGLLPGQRFYIVHPQHQIYQNPIYPGLPNGFRPNIQVPGYQRFYIVQAQPTVGDGSFATPAGYQNAFLVDPSGQGIASPQVLQPNFQRLITGQTPQQVQPNPSAQNYQAPAKNTAEPLRNYQEPLRNYQEQNSNYALPVRSYQQQSADYTGAQPQQFGPGFAAGAPPAALPFFGFGRQVGLPFQQQGINQLNPNQIQFSQLLSLQPGQSPQPLQFQPGQYVSPGQFAVATPAQTTPDQGGAQAQGRNDNNDYSEEKNEDLEGSMNESRTETITSDESSKKTEDMSTEPAPQDPKNSDESKKIVDDEQPATSPKETTNVQIFPKRSNKQ